VQAFQGNPQRKLHFPIQTLVVMHIGEFWKVDLPAQNLSGLTHCTGMLSTANLKQIFYQLGGLTLIPVEFLVFHRQKFIAFVTEFD
jgi:hypothetical protein